MVARVIDYVALRFMLLFTLFVVLLYFSRAIIVSLLIAIFITIAVSLALVLVRRNKIRRHIERDILRIKQKCLLEELTLMESGAFYDYISRLFDGLHNITPTEDGFWAEKEGAEFRVFQNHPSTQCGADDILKICRQRGGEQTIVVSLGEFSDAAKTFGTSLGMRLVSGQTVLKMAAEKDMLPDEKAAQEKARREMSETIITLSKLKQHAFDKTKVKAYILCGMVVMAWSFVMGFRIYYPIIAIVCFVMAALTFRRNKSHEESQALE
ncbi:MAG: hypothetical protein GXW96_01005 [Christensenellaceae bacterium]|nr:hypothetical protein [Christensenellaceae bacterium]